MALDALSKAAQIGSTAYSWTNTEHVKQRSVEAMTMIVMLYALKKATEGRMLESGGSMTVGAILWMNHEAMIKQNLANTAVVFSTQVSNLEGQLTVINGQIESLRGLQTKGGQLLGEQEKQLQELEKQREAIELDIKSRKELLIRMEKQIQRLEQSVTDTTEQLNKTSITILALLGDAKGKLEQFKSIESQQAAVQLANAVAVLAGVAKSIAEQKK
ncbi:MAG: hypothetical protein H7A38_00410 [Chlamydiales bacterium]|nr:hypothetical protein [Chlamydiales bacterium]